MVGCSKIQAFQHHLSENLTTEQFQQPENVVTQIVTQFVWSSTVVLGLFQYTMI